jgi:hypothetical protein
MSRYYDKLTLPLAQVIANIFDAPVDAILEARLDVNDNIYGQLLSGGNVYAYKADDYAIEVSYLPEETAEINSYTQLLLDDLGIRVDGIYNPFEYARGLLRMDFGQVRCKSGGTPCGRRCLPRGQKCRKGVGAAAGIKQTKANLSRNKGGGGFGKTALKVGLMAGAGVIAGGAVASAINRKKGREEVDKGWDELVDQSEELKRKASGSR